MGKTKCKDADKTKHPVIKESHKYVCKKCGSGAKKEERLCKPKKISK